jgi:autotransporter-associated beta strand protein
MTKSRSATLLASAVGVVLGAGSAKAAAILGPSTWTNTAGTASQSWTLGANWDTNPDYPSGIGAVAIINSGTTNRATSFTPTAGEGAVTIGSLTVNNSTAFTNTFTSGNNTVTLDAAGAGPAEIKLLGNATSGGVPTTLGAIWLFQDNVKLTVDKTSSGSSVADVSITGPISGPGGLIKAGGGTAVITNGSGTTKTYTGATSVEAGRLRVGTLTGSPGVPLSNTSSVSVSAGAQLSLGPNAATFTFGTSAATPINLNGEGLATGSAAGGTIGASGAMRA